MLYPDGQVHLTSLSGATYIFPTTVTVGTIQRTWRSHTARLATGREVHVAGPFPQPFDVPIVGMVHDTDQAAADARVASLLAILNDAPVEVRVSGAGAERFVTTVPNRLSRQDVGLGIHGAINLNLRSLEPHWVGDTVVETYAGLTTQPEFRQLVVSAGNAMPNPVVTFTFTTGANVSNPQIWNTTGDDREFTVPGTFTTGDVLVVDTENMRVYDNNGVSYLDQMGSDFLFNGWPLSLGSNTLSIYGSGTMRMDVSIAYRPKWV